MANAQARYEIVADDKTRAAWQSAIRTAESNQKTLSGTFSKIGVGGAVAGVAIAKIGAEFVRAIGHAVEFGDAINKAMIKAGVGAEQMSSLAYAAQQNDIALNSLSDSLKKMQVATSEANAGNKAMQETFAGLGIELKRFSDLQADKQFERMADAIAAIPDPADRARAAVEVFGKSGADLLPLFENGAAGIRKWRSEAKAFGQELSTDQVQALARAEESVKRLQASWDGLGNKIGSFIAPLLADTADFGRQLLGASTYIEAVEKRLKFLRDERSSIPIVFNFGYLDGYGTIMGKDQLDKAIAEYEVRLDILRNPSKARGGGASRQRAEERPKAKDWEAIWRPAGDRAGDRFETMREFRENIDWLEQIDQESKDRLSAFAELERDTMSTMENRTTKEANADMDGFYDRLKKIGEGTSELSVFADEAFRRMQGGLAEFLFDPFDDGLKGMVAGFADAMRRMIAEAAAAQIMKSLFGAAGGAGGGLGSFLGGLFGAQFGGFKAEGGPLDQGKWYIAGERGPEPIWGGGPGAFAMGYGQQSAPVVRIENHLHVDARHATQDAAQALVSSMPEILRRNNDALESKIIEGIRRRRYPL